MTSKKRRFVDEYLIDSNAVQAAIRAGYTPNNTKAFAYKLLKEPEIAKAILDEQLKIRENNSITKQDLLDDLIKIKNMYLENPKYSGNSIKAIISINKMLGFDAPQKVDVTSNGDSIVWNEVKTYSDKKKK